VKTLSWPNKIIFFFNIISALLLIASYGASYISPKIFWPLSFFGLAYPIILLLNITFIIYWSLFRKKQLLLSLIVIILGFTNLRTHFQLQFGASDTVESNPNIVKVITYNVRLFDLYEWSSDRSTDNKIFELMKNADADIISMQEFMYHDDGSIISADSMVKSFKANHLHTEYTLVYNSTNKLGIATFSSYPIVGKGCIDFGKKTHNICMYTDIKINTDTIRVYNAHFQSIQFGKEDYLTLEKIDDADADNEKQWMGIRKILKKLKIAFSRRADQAEMVAEHITHSPYPIIFCGDFNDTPGSYTYHSIAKQLNDCFVEKGSGIGNTYIGLFPSFRIDYILHSDQLECLQYERIEKKYSDHYAISAWLKVK
jgi:endonuclease/exonuclease/phosphatase family metal-dependent hydrolase